jgi:hypothetical protein
VDFDDNFPPRYVKVTLDMNAGEVLKHVVHELLHVTFSELVRGKFDDTLEEVFVMAMTDYMYAWIAKSPARELRWQELINRKLAEPDPDVEPVPLFEQQERP